MMKRQRVLADFGDFAIQSDDLDEVLTEACRLVGEALGTGRAKVLEIQTDRRELLVRAGVGWPPNIVGTVCLKMSDRSSETYAIEAAEPVLSQDIRFETRFDIPEFMEQAGVVALVNVPIFVPGQRPYGVLQVDATTPRQFGDDEVQFLRTYATILGPVIDRLHLLDERTKAQAHLEASEVRHRLLIESWAQAVWETDADGIVVADSPSWRAYTGQSLSEWLGYGWLDAIHPDDRAYAERQWHEAIAARGLVNAEFRLRAPGGGWRWTNVRAAPVLDAAGRIEKWAGINIDIDARKRTEAALQQREAELARVQRIGAVGGLDIDVAGGLTSRRSPEYLRLHGLPPDAAEATHDEWQSRVHPADLARAEKTLFSALDGDAANYESEYRIIRPNDGEMRWIAARADIERDAAGRPQRLVGAHIDVTEQKLAQEALRVSEERLRSAAEVAKFALWDWNVESGAVIWSDEHYRLQGYKVGEVAPSYEAWLARVHPDDRAETESAIATARDTRNEYVHESRVLHPDGAIRWVSARARFFYDGEGRPVRMIGAMLDTTDRREWEERQKILLAELQHRVRNILSVIRSIVSRSDDGERSTINYVHHLQGRLSALARTQVLLTRKAGAGVDLEDMIRDELVAQATRPEQFSLEGEDVELSPKAAEVLSLAIHELATNATKYGAFSKQDGSLRVEWQREHRDGEDWLVLGWTERGVAIVDAVPRRQGFGTELISRRIPYELHGHGTFSLRPGGLHSVIEFPLRHGDSILQTSGTTR